MKSKVKSKSLGMKKRKAIGGAKGRKVKVQTPNAGVAAKRSALSPSQPHSKSYGR